MVLALKSEAGTSKSSVEDVAVVPKRSVFVSHSHADRRLALAMKVLIGETYSGVIQAFISSDPTPGGGIQPGDEWFSRIQSELYSAEAVWVLATKTSIGRPWIYWEAGLGRATCRGGVIVLRVGLSERDVHSPLNQFQSYDGSTCGAGGIDELLRKVGDRIGMNIPTVLVEAATGEWSKFLQDYKPDLETVVTNAVTPEQVSQIEGLIARLESVVSTVARPSGVRVPRPDIRERRPRPEPRPLAERVAEAFENRNIQAKKREAQSMLRTRFFGSEDLILDDCASFFACVEALPSSVEIAFYGIDFEGDALFKVTADRVPFDIFLGGQSLLDLNVPPKVEGRAAVLLAALVEAIKGESSPS